MLFYPLLKLAFRNLFANKGKSILTMLGIIIGVTSVILIISVGAGAQSLIFNQVKSAGSNLISVLPGGQDEEEQGPPAAVQGVIITTLTYDDALALKDEKNVPGVEAVSAYARGSVVATRRDISSRAVLTGVSTGFPKIIEAEVEQGRFFTEEEDLGMARVVVLGHEAWQEFFAPEENPIGEQIRLGNSNFKVIGILEKKGTVAFENQDEQIFVPVKTAQKIILGIDHVSMVRVKIADSDRVDQAVLDIESVLRERHDIKEGERDDFMVGSQEEALSALASVTDALRFFLAAVAAVSLLVGGIGIMNIMLVTVTERTREVGLRKAVGAKESSIMIQFLIESSLISLAGGMIGIVLGALISFLVSVVANHLGYNWDFIVSLASILLACSVSVCVGVIFGLYPARKAAQLDPIDALRYE